MANAKVRLGVAFDGEREVKTAVSNINAQLKTLKSESEKVKSAFEGQERSEKALLETSRVLAQTLQTQKTKIDTLRQAVKDAADHEEKWKSKISGTEKELANEKAKLDAMKNSTGATTEEIKKQEKVVADLGDRLQKEQSSLTKANTNTEKWKNTLNKAETELNKTQKELDQTNDELSRMSGKADKAGKELDDMADSSGKVGKQLSTAGIALGTFIGNLASDVLRKAAQAMKSLATSTVRVGADFDSSMSKVKAVSGATGDQFDKLREKAREMGATTKFTAAESADALNYMAMAGWKTKEMISGISGVMDLAAASGEDLATTSDIVTDALSAFGLKARDSGHFADILAAASSNANTNVTMMGETFKYAAPVAGALGYSAEDVAEAVGLMANQGIKASQAGTGLRTIMTKLNKDFVISGKELGKVKIATTNADGSMRELSDILADSRAAFSKLTESEKAQTAQSLVGKNAMSAFLALMQAAPEDVDKLSQAIKNCDGAAKKMADTMNDNLKGDIDKLKSAWQDLQIELSDSAKGPLRDIVQTVTNDVIPAFKAMVTNSEHTAGKIRNAFSNLMDKIGDFGGNLVSAFFGDKAGSAVKDAIKVITGAVKDLMGVLKDIGPIIGEILNLAGQIVKAILPVVIDLIKMLAPFVEKLFSMISKAVSSVLPMVSSVLSGIVDSLKPLLDALSPIFDVVGKIFEELAPLFTSIGELVGNVLRLGSALSPLNAILQALAPVLELIGTLLKPIFDFIKLISDGLNWVVEGFLNLIGCGVDKSLEEDRQAMEDFAAECDSAREKIDGLKKSQEETLDSINEEYDGYKKLVKELDGYIDKNGKVKDGYEARADEIVNTLNSQFKTEIELTDGVVKKWGELKQAVIDEMKVEQLRESIKAGASLREQANDLEWMKEAVNRVKEAKMQHTQAQIAYDEAVAKGRGVEEATEQLELAKGALYDSEKALGDAKKAVEDYDKAQKALASGNIKEVEKSLESYNRKLLSGRYLSHASLEQQKTETESTLADIQALYKDTGLEIYKDEAAKYQKLADLSQKEIDDQKERDQESIRQLINTKDEKLNWVEKTAKEMAKASELGGRELNESNAKAQEASRDKPVAASRETGSQTAKALEDNSDGTKAGEKLDRENEESITENAEKPKQAARDVATGTSAELENNTNGSSAGLKADSDFADSIRKFADKIYSAAGYAAGQADSGLASGDSYSVGMNIALGAANGIRDYAYRILNEGMTAIGNAIAGMKKKAEEQSPSKATFKIGAFLSIGAALGIKSKAKSVSKAASNAIGAAIGAAKKALKSAKPVGEQLMDGMAKGAQRKIQSTTANMRNSVALVLKNARKTVEAYTKAGKFEGAGDRLTSLTSSGISAAGNATVKTVTKNLNTQFSAVKAAFNTQIKTLTTNSNAKIKNLNTQLKKEEKNSAVKLKTLEKQLDKTEKDRDKKLDAAEKARDNKLKDLEKQRNKKLDGADKNEKKRINAQYQAQKKAANASFQTAKKQISADYKQQKTALQNQIKAEKSRSAAQKKALNASIKAEEKAAKKKKTTLEKSLKTVSDNQTKIVEAAKKAVASEIDTLTLYMEQQLEKISSKYQEKYDEIKAKNDALRTTLENSASQRFTESTDRRGNVTVTLSSLTAQTKKINDYMANLKKVRSQFTSYAGAAAAQSLIDEIVSMGVEEGNKYMTAILQLSKSGLKSYAVNYKKQMTAIAGFTATNLSSKTGFYTEHFKEIKEGYDREIKNLQNTISKKFTDIGVNAAKAFASGTKANQNAVVKAIQSLGSAAVKQLKKTLGIKSPSRVFQDLGLLTDEGLAIGISDNARMAVDAVGRMSDDMIAAMDYNAGRLSAGAAGMNSLLRRQNMPEIQERPIVVITQIDGKQVGYATAKYVTRQQRFEQRGNYA